MTHLKILGKTWRIRFAPNMGCRGDCDPPNQPGKEIRISTALGGEERLEVIIHESLHCAGWFIDESFVEQFAAGVARNLWRLGYRPMEEAKR